MWTYNQVESVFKNIKYQKTKFNFTLTVFRLLSEILLDLDRTFAMWYLIEIWHITNLRHLVVNAK